MWVCESCVERRAIGDRCGSASGRERARGGLHNGTHLWMTVMPFAQIGGDWTALFINLEPNLV
jgi:hypothetical protein